MSSYLPKIQNSGGSEEKREPKTIDDWKYYAKELKLRIRKLEKKQADLVLKLSEKSYGTTTSHNHKKLVGFAVSASRAVLKIQKIWRGCRQRKAFKQELRKLASKQPSGYTRGNRTSSNQIVIQEVNKSVQKLGLNLEMLYRACDRDSNGSVYLDDFKHFLKRLNLRITASQLNRFLLMLDEDCTGIISREEYMDALASYGVGSERDAERNNAQTYEQECMLRFAASLKQQDINPEEVCNFCDNSNASTMRTVQLAKFIHNMSDGFQEKEINGILMYFDLDRTSHIDKNFFIEEIQKADRVLHNNPSVLERSRSPLRMSFGSLGFKSAGSRFEQEDQMSATQTINSDSPLRATKPSRPQTAQGRLGKEAPGRLKTAKFAEPLVEETKANMSKTQPVQDNKRYGRFTDESINDQFKENKALKIKPMRVRDESPSMIELGDLKRIIIMMELNSKPIYSFFESLLLKMKGVNKSLTVMEVSKMLDAEYKGIVKPAEKSILMKNLDSNMNGDLDINEAIAFILRISNCSKERVLSSRLVKIGLARKLELDGIPTNTFFRNKSIDPRKVVLLDRLIEVIGPMFGISMEDGAEVFHDLDDSDQSLVDMGKFVKNIDAFRGDKGALEDDPKQSQKPAKKETNLQSSAALEEDFQKKFQEAKAKKMLQKKENSDGKAEHAAMKKIIVQMEIENKPIYLLFEKVLAEMHKPVEGFPVSRIQMILQQEWKGVVNMKEQTTVIRTIDSNFNGSINAEELYSFVMSWTQISQEKILSITALQMLLAKLMNVRNCGTEEFFKLIKIDVSKQRISVQKLGEAIGGYLNLEERIWGPLFSELPEIDGVTDITKFMTKVKSYRVGDESEGSTQQQIVAIERRDEQSNVQDLVRSLRSSNIEPAAVFEKACKPGFSYASLENIRSTLKKILPDYPILKLNMALKVIDIDKNGFISRGEYKMMMLDKIAQDKLAKNPDKDEVDAYAGGMDPEILKFKNAIEKEKIDSLEFFEKCDENRNGVVSLLELKRAINNLLPRSHLSAGKFLLTSYSRNQKFYRHYYYTLFVN